MFCELLQEKVTAEECAKCWNEQMEELVKEYMVRRLTVGKPRTITHEDCMQENILERDSNEQNRESREAARTGSQ